MEAYKKIFSIPKTPELMKVDSDGETRKKTLSVLAEEIFSMNPNAWIKLYSTKENKIIWQGFVDYFLADFTPRFLKSCAQEISVDDSGITIVTR